MFKKYLVLTLIICLLFSIVVMGAPTYVNIGPTTDFEDDVGVPADKGYYINDILFSTTGLIDISTLAKTDGGIIIGDGTNFVLETGAIARASLGLTIGTNIQAYDAGLTSLAGLTYVSPSFIKVTATDTYAIRTIAEVKADLDLEIGTDILAYQAIGIANDNLVEMDDTDAAIDDYCKLTANGVVGRSYAEVKTDLAYTDAEIKAILVDEVTKTGDFTAGRIAKINNATGIIEEGTNTDTDVADAVTKKHTSGSETQGGDISGAVGNASVNKIKRGLDASKSATPAVGDIYLATDTDKLYKCITAEAWTLLKNLDLSGNNVADLADITSPGADIEDAVTKKHSQNTDTDLDATFEATFVKKADTVNVLSDITSTGANIEDAVTKKHTAGADTTLGTLTADVNMGTHKLTGLSVPSASGESVRTTATITEANLEDAVSKKHAQNTDTAAGGEWDFGANTAGFTIQTAGGDGTTTINWTLGNYFKFTHGAMAETFTFDPAPTNPCHLTLIIIQDGTGGRDSTWPAPVKWLGDEPTWTDGGAGKGIVVAMVYDGTSYWSQGTPWEE